MKSFSSKSMAMYLLCWLAMVVTPEAQAMNPACKALFTPSLSKADLKAQEDLFVMMTYAQHVLFKSMGRGKTLTSKQLDNVDKDIDQIVARLEKRKSLDVVVTERARDIVGVLRQTMKLDEFKNKWENPAAELTEEDRQDLAIRRDLRLAENELGRLLARADYVFENEIVDGRNSQHLELEKSIRSSANQLLTAAGLSASDVAASPEYKDLIEEAFRVARELRGVRIDNTWKRVRHFNDTPITVRFDRREFPGINSVEGRISFHDLSRNGVLVERLIGVTFAIQINATDARASGLPRNDLSVDVPTVGTANETSKVRRRYRAGHILKDRHNSLLEKSGSQNLRLLSKVTPATRRESSDGPSPAYFSFKDQTFNTQNLIDDPRRAYQSPELALFIEQLFRKTYFGR